MERSEMNITILDDYQDTIRTLACFPKVAGHTVTIWNDHTKDVDTLAGRLKDTEALVFLSMDNVICAPHLGYVERDGLEHMFGGIFDQILAYASGKPINVANPEALKR